MIKNPLLVSLVFCVACSRRPSDEWVATQIKAAFYADATVKQANLSVWVKDGEVRLAGTVPGADVQLRAFKLAYATRGVNAIHDDMRIVAIASPFPAMPTAPAVTKVKPGFMLPRERAMAVPHKPEIVPEPPEVLFRGDPEERERTPSGTERASTGQWMAGNLTPPGVESPSPSEAASELSLNGIDPARQPIADLHLNGAGSFGPNALYQKWFKELTHTNSGIRVTYQSIGSGAGVKQLIDHAVDFASAEQTIADRQLKAGQPKLIHIPLMMHAVVPVLNLPGSTGPLRLPREVLAKIFLGEITAWNDPALTAANPGIALPRRQIIVVHRSDGGSSTQMWSAFLSKVSPEWQQRFGANDSIDWPTGMGGMGDDGLLGLVARNQYSIGYAELGAAAKLENRNDIRIGLMQNAAGHYVEAGAHAVEAAASGALAKSDVVGRMSILDSAAKDAYPVAGFEWLVLPERTTDDKRRAEAVLLQWLFSRPQRDVESYGYFALPEALAKVYRSQISFR